MGNDGHVHPGRKPTRLLLLVAGPLSLGLGITGVLLPLLSTTPFLLPAAACYIRSSPGL